MESKKIKLFSFSHFNEYILLILEKTERTIDLIEGFLDDVKLGESLGHLKECLKLIDVKTSFVGNTSVEIIFGKEKIFFITNIQDETSKKNLISRVKKETEFVVKNNYNIKKRSRST